MPTTYNGIGTHYYGKRNRSSRTAACRSCRRVGLLESYDTRLWVVVVFIPVFPLGRKRIIDSCPACTRHFAADASKFEQARQLQTSGSMDRFRRDPSPSAALEIHAGLLAFHQHDQAAEFRASAMEVFPDHAGLRAGLAAHLDQILEYGQAGVLYEKALALDPDLPEARAGTALRRINAGALDEAHDLLDFLKAQGAGQAHSLGPLETLAHAYQSAGRHEEALELAACLLRELPSVGQMYVFRSFVAKSERALRRPESILPRRQRSLGALFRKSGSPYAPWVRKTVIGGLTVALLATGLAINNWYIMNHRRIRVVNATGTPVKVAVDDGPAAEFPGDGNLTVPEGHHRLRLTGAVDETHEVDLNSDLFARWFKSPVWVLNPGGEAAFDEATVVYSQQPQPAQHNLIVGRPFIAMPHVDYAFEEPPSSISSKKGAGPITKTVLRRVPFTDQQAFLELLPVDREAALRMAERKLHLQPENPPLIDDYVENLATTDPARAEAFLKSGLDVRPVAVAWHRAYQNVAGIGKDKASLVSQYDGYLASTPGDARLIYLRGRVDPDHAKQVEFYRRSIEVDPRLAWPWMALGAHAGSRADWAESIRCLEKAKELGLGSESIAEPLHIARLASGQAPAMVDEYRREIMARPGDLNLLVLLCDALASSGRGEEIDAEIQNGILRLPQQAQFQVGPLVRPVGLYMAGKPDKAAEAARQNRGRGGDSILAQSLLALGRSGEVADDKSFDKLGEDPWNALAIGLGLALDGRKEDSDRWRERAAIRLETLHDDLKVVAKLLRAAEPPAATDLERLTIAPSAKALTFAVLAARFPDRAAEFGAEAARFNVRHNPPYELVRRAIAGQGRKAP
jgi:tetratricopeptide (TPR) repeat protein